MGKSKQEPKGITDAETEKLLRMARKAHALFTKEQMYELARGITEDNFGYGACAPGPFLLTESAQCSERRSGHAIESKLRRALPAGGLRW